MFNNQQGHEEAIRERRHLAEELRKQRIFNAKERIIGIDKAGLDKQVDEKRRLHEQDTATNQAYVANLLAWDRTALRDQKWQENAIRKLNQDIDRFRLLQQEPSSRRDFDLYDPDRLKKDRPARILDDDPNCSVSGVQKLDGEDLDYQERKKEQQEQLFHSLQHQEEENRKLGCKLREQENAYVNNIILQDKEAQCQMEVEQHALRSVNTAMREFNRRMAEDQYQQQQEENLREDEDRLEHIRNCYYGNLLSENPDVARSVFGPHRVIPDRWKGMTQEQRESIWRSQLKQIKERKSKEEEETQNELQYGRRLLDQDRDALLQEREWQRRMKQHNRQLSRYNELLAQDQSEFQRYLKDTVYTNRPTAAYFNQFNTTSR